MRLPLRLRIFNCLALGMLLSVCLLFLAVTITAISGARARSQIAVSAPAPAPQPSVSWYAAQLLPCFSGGDYHCDFRSKREEPNCGFRSGSSSAAFFFITAISGARVRSQIAASALAPDLQLSVSWYAAQRVPAFSRGAILLQAFCRLPPPRRGGPRTGGRGTALQFRPPSKKRRCE